MGNCVAHDAKKWRGSAVFYKAHPQERASFYFRAVVPALQDKSPELGEYRY
jgi:hypothetical protein